MASSCLRLRARTLAARCGYCGTTTLCSVDVFNGFVSTFSFTVKEVEDAGGEGFAFVLQDVGPYSVGSPGAGLGYDGLGHGIAVEFDTAKTDAKGDPEEPHVSLHHGIFNTLTSKEPDAARQPFRKALLDLASYDAMPGSRLRPRFATVEYRPAPGTIVVSVSHKEAEEAGGRVVHKELLSVEVGELRGAFHVGFTASTGKSFAKFALLSWSFKALGAGESEQKVGHLCTPDFNGPMCSMTNEAASRECPRRSNCRECVEDVYNCVYCGGGNGDRDIGEGGVAKGEKEGEKEGEGRCVVGVAENVRTCSSLALEPGSCSGGLSRVWLYLLIAALVVVVVFGVVLFRMLPVAQSFRAISLLVALVGGALSGMLLSLLVSAMLVEISETAFFGAAYGLFFLVECFLIAGHIVKEEVPVRGWRHPHVLLLCACDVCIFVAALSCFLLDKRFIRWLPEAPKVLFYANLGATLNFCLVFSVAESVAEVAQRCCSADQQGYAANIVSSRELELESGKSAAGRRASVIAHQARVALVAAASVLSGLWFGFMFGTLRIEEEALYRVALALRREAAYTYPVGALLGGASAMLLQLLQLPLASDEQIDRILRDNARDGL